jgi:hypothetical protein
MKHSQKVLACVVAGVTLCTAATAITGDRSMPYEGIVERNLFGLKPPPPPPDPDAANKPQPSKITLTGITTILGNKRALMKTPPPQAKLGEQAKTEQSYILAVGERENEIEVLDIDEIAGTVKVKNAGVIETVSFKENGVKQAAGGGVPGVPGVPPPAGINPYAPAPPAVNPAIPMPNRIPRLPVSGVTPTANTAAAAGGSPYAGAAPAAYGGTATPNIKLGNVTMPLGSVPSQPAPAQPQMMQVTADEQRIHMEVQRQRDFGNPDAPPLPPTELTPSELDPTKNTPTPPGF